MANKLREWRKQYKYTRKELSKVSGVSESTIQRLEDGRLKFENCKLTTLIALSTALGISVAALLPRQLQEKVL